MAAPVTDAARLSTTPPLNPTSSSTAQNIFNITVKNGGSSHAPPLTGNPPPSIKDLQSQIEEAAAKITEASNCTDTTIASPLADEAKTLLLNAFILIDSIKPTQSKIMLLNILYPQLGNLKRFYQNFPNQNDPVIRDKEVACFFKIERLEKLIFPSSSPQKYHVIFSLIADVEYDLCLAIANPDSKERVTAFIARSHEALEDVSIFMDSDECSVSSEDRNKLVDSYQKIVNKLKTTAQSLQVGNQIQETRLEPPTRIVTPNPKKPESPRMKTVFKLAILAFVGYLVVSFCRRVYVRLTR